MQTPQRRPELTGQVWEHEPLDSLWLLRVQRAGEQAFRQALTSGALNARMRSCRLILRVLERQERGMTPVEPGWGLGDESGSVGRVDWRGRDFVAERPFKRLLQNHFS